MTRRQYVTLVVLAVTAAFLGGMVSGKLPSRVHAAADSDTEKPDYLAVRGLRVVDKAGKMRAYLGMEEGDPLFFMENKSGKPRVVLGAYDAGASLSLMGDEDKTGIAIFEPTEERVVWRAPQTLTIPSDK